MPSIPKFKGSGRTSETAARGSRQVPTHNARDLEPQPWLGVTSRVALDLLVLAGIAFACVALMVLGTL